MFKLNERGNFVAVEEGVMLIGDVADLSWMGDGVFQVNQDGVLCLEGEVFTLSDLKQIIREVIEEGYAEQAAYYTEPGRELGKQPVLSEGA